MGDEHDTAFADLEDMVECGYGIQPCPFCGYRPHPRQDFAGLYLEHVNPMCILQIFHISNYAEAVMWNNRVRIHANKKRD